MPRGSSELGRKNPPNILITIDTCAASEANYMLLHLITKLYAAAYQKKILPYNRKIFMVLPEQILRESAHVHNRLLLQYIMGPNASANLQIVSDSIRRSALARYSERHKNKTSSKVEIFRTGYCDGFSHRLSKKVLPKIVHKYLDAENSLSGKERRDLLAYADKITPEQVEKLAAWFKNWPAGDSPKNDTGRSKAMLSLAYSLIAELMQATRDKRYNEFIENPNIRRNLKSPAVIQTLKMLGIWINRHEGKMQKAHKDCGDFAILQMYSKYLYRNEGTWSYAVVSKDEGLLTNIAEFHLGADSAQNISHPEYPKSSKQYKLRANMPNKMPALTMRPYEFYFFAVQALQEVTGLDFTYNFSTGYNDIITRVNRWLKGKGQEMPGEVIECIVAIKDNLRTLPRDLKKTANLMQKHSKNKFLDANISFTRQFISTNIIPLKEDFKPEKPIYPQRKPRNLFPNQPPVNER